jgi:hypothetical protein
MEVPACSQENEILVLKSYLQSILDKSIQWFSDMSVVKELFEYLNNGTFLNN